MNHQKRRGKRLYLGGRREAVTADGIFRPDSWETGSHAVAPTTQDLGKASPLLLNLDSVKIALKTMELERLGQSEGVELCHRELLQKAD